MRRLLSRHRRERGAVAVEAAIIFPLLIVLTFGIIEFSLLLRDYVSLNSLVRNGVRIATTLPRDPDFVVTTKTAMDRAGSALPQDSYEELWIYEADAAGMPLGGSFDVGSCTSSNNCVAYVWNDARDEFRPASGSDWDHESINACPGDDNADVVGVYLKASHEGLTGLFFDRLEISDRAVSKFEPIATSFGVECRPGV